MCDAEETLPAALRSALDQTFTQLELVVVLNGITDASAHIVRRVASGDPRVRILERPEAQLALALQAGLEACRGELVVRHDADDTMDPRRVALQVDALDANPQWVGVTCGVRCVGLGDAPGEGMMRHVAWLNGLRTPEAIRSGRFIDAPLAHPAVTFRRRAVMEIGGYRDGDFPEDHDLWLRLFESGASFGRVEDTLVDWTDRPDRFTRTNTRCRDEARRHLVHTYLGSGPLAGGRRARIWGAGPFGKRHARDLHGRFDCVDDLIDILVGTSTDEDDDGRPDECPPPCPADLDGDGSVGATDITLCLTSWGTSGGAADINSDGIVAAEDLTIILSSWGPC